jgi:hypothetical protein
MVALDVVLQTLPARERLPAGAALEGLHLRRKKIKYFKDAK